VIFDNKSREFYLVNIPLTDSAMEQSNLRLEEALYRMGIIYKENLLDYRASIDAFEELLSRYPRGRYTAPAMYYLHDLNNNIQNPERAGYYKAQLLASYPDSHYSKLLNNPNYIRELEEEEKKVVRIYEKIFSSYQQKDYEKVISHADSAVLLYGEDGLVPKFKYIKSLAVGAIRGKEAMKVEFDSLIAQHPAAEESIQAQEIIDYMFVEFPEIKEAEQAKEAEEVYIGYNPEQEHYFLLALRSGENVNQVSFDLLNYNLDYFNQYDLNIERVELEETYNMLAVKSFTDSDGADRYLQAVADSSEIILKEIPSEQYRLMIISADNFAILTREMEHIPYYLFYRKHYLNIE